LLHQFVGNVRVQIRLAASPAHRIQQARNTPIDPVLTADRADQPQVSWFELTDFLEFGADPLHVIGVKPACVRPTLLCA
jgi:hypothetical protein